MTSATVVLLLTVPLSHKYISMGAVNAFYIVWNATRNILGSTHSQKLQLLL